MFFSEPVVLKNINVGLLKAETQALASKTMNLKMNYKKRGLGRFMYVTFKGGWLTSYLLADFHLAD